jgi:hypothetical protein
MRFSVIFTIGSKKKQFIWMLVIYCTHQIQIEKTFYEKNSFICLSGT